jgi:hypothetical protein
MGISARADSKPTGAGARIDLYEELGRDQAFEINKDVFKLRVDPKMHLSGKSSRVDCNTDLNHVSLSLAREPIDSIKVQ